MIRSRYRVAFCTGIIALLIGACAGQPAASPPAAATQPPVAVTTATDTPTSVPPSSTPTIEPSPTVEPSPRFDPTTPLAGAALVDALRRGGYVIYFRHAATDRTQADTDTENLENCQTQRNLNDQGRADARAIGEAFTILGIPVGQVLSSGFCRARDTAQLAFGGAEITPDLTGFPSDLQEQRIAALRRMLSTPPQVGTNTVLVAHGFNIQNTADISIVEGEAAVFAPLGPGGFALIARIRPGEWAELVRLAGSGAQPVPMNCEPTRPDGLGPFYVPGAPVRSSVGQGHVLSGVVRVSADSYQPLVTQYYPADGQTEGTLDLVLVPAN